jgi:hypothetical protein
LVQLTNLEVEPLQTISLLHPLISYSELEINLTCARTREPRATIAPVDSGYAKVDVGKRMQSSIEDEECSVLQVLVTATSC